MMSYYLHVYLKYSFTHFDVKYIMNFFQDWYVIFTFVLMTSLFPQKYD